ncbi:hypothetical protein TH5_08950 [Thalassospira xianhensis MCCC 1A02616]|uniref:HD Cas3-type domain-containing protein n=1 Tax=Thalassospira xianhensis MCCC 1A02616 TaxID=1177929 RepID=A0A367UEB7_9PROT|nr:hypothetical protein TH5_08950 [Thalassospira xianhensis MCCC 1A02616]
MVPVCGKADANGVHHLAHHMADVAACFQEIIRLRVFSQILDAVAGRPLTATDHERLAVAAFLHDIGKICPGFQRKLWAYLPMPCFNLAKAPVSGHIREGVAIVGGALNHKLSENLQILRMQDWGISFSGILLSSLSHHGAPVAANDHYSPDWSPINEVGYDPLHAARDLGVAVQQWFPLAFEDGGDDLPENAEFQHFVAGLIQLSDWLGSMKDYFAFRPDFEPDYSRRARSIAKRLIRDVGLDVAHLAEKLSPRLKFEDVFEGRLPRPVQQLIGTVPLDEQVVILESETGSGKTEAALWRWFLLFMAGKVDSLYFALPTRAAARQLHGRIHRMMKALFGDDAPQTVLAVPGYLKAGDVEGVALPDFKTRWDDDGHSDEKMRRGRWAAENCKRFLAATIAVGTVDQLMLGGMRVQHAHLRMSSAARSFVVIDEVHASDPYMTEIIAHFISLHTKLGGHSMLMSATLGSAARMRWLTGTRRNDQRPDAQSAVSAAFPAIWTRHSSVPYSVPAESWQLPGKSVKMVLAEDWTSDTAVNYALGAAMKGARVLVIRNTVSAATDTWLKAVERGYGNLLLQVAGAPALHHSRFAPEDRQLLDLAVEEALSPIRTPGHGLIVIGTQTLEQSLDIDADYLVTDLVPSDVLLQRIGRLHRHDIGRPEGFEQPVCVVMVPSDGLDQFTAPAMENGLGATKKWEGVYLNLHACELTRRLIADLPVWELPRMNRELVERTTHQSFIDALSEELGSSWRSYQAGYDGVGMATAQAGKHVLLDSSKDFFVTPPLPQDGDAIRTRLGADGARIQFDAPYSGPFGQDVHSVTLPSYWSGTIHSNTPVTPIAERGGLSFEIAGVSFRYMRTGLRKESS